MGLGMLLYTCDPRNTGGWGRRTANWRLAWTNVVRFLSQKMKTKLKMKAGVVRWVCIKVFLCTPDGLSSSLRTYTMEEESLLLQVVLWPSHMCSYSYTHKINERKKTIVWTFGSHSSCMFVSQVKVQLLNTSRVSCYLCLTGRTASASLWSSGAALLFRSSYP